MPDKYLIGVNVKHLREMYCEAPRAFDQGVFSRYNPYMIDKTKCTVGKRPVRGKGGTLSDQGNLEYWLTRSTRERLAAVETLRRQHSGRNGTRLCRVVSVLTRTKG